MMERYEVDVKHLMKDHASQNIPLTYEEGYQLGLYALRGCRGNEWKPQIQSMALFSALHNKMTYGWQWDKRKEHLHSHRLPRTAAEQIAGICTAIFEQDIAVSEFNFLQPDVPYVMDNCGMGGDLVTTANISTLAAFIAAAAKIPMCKHGSPANADQERYGSSDFISQICGINTYASKSGIESCVEEFGFGYTEALDTRYKHIHLQTHKIAQLPHMNDIIGPITNPVDPKKLQRKVLGANHLISPRVVAEAYRILNAKGITHLEHGMFVRGFTSDYHYEGIDEVSICDAGTQVVEIKNNEIHEYHLSAGDFGIKPVSVDVIRPDGNKGEYSMQILKGKIDGPRLNIILANASVLFYLAGRSSNMKKCYELAEQTFRSGKAYETMLAVKEFLSRKD
jgi:anthranilate phosphoribosyltransferase